MQWHALDGSADGNSYRIAYHIPIPSANNGAGVNYRAALVGSGIGGTTVMTEGNGSGQITTAEKALIASGQILEVVEQYQTNPTEVSNATTLQTNITTRYTALANTSGVFITALKNRLAFWGGTSVS